MTQSGLLLPQPNDRAAFYHLSIQEFLAAERILRVEDDLEPVFCLHSAVAEWHPTLMFVFAGTIASKTPKWGADLLARLINCQDRAALKENPTPALFIAEALELYFDKEYFIPDALLANFRRMSLDAIEDEIEIVDRRKLALSLGRLGDPRIRDLRDPEGYVEVPAGIYYYGSGLKETKIEIATSFRIGLYPVTNSQYRTFLKDSGFDQTLGAGGLSMTHYRRWTAPNQPVVGVTPAKAEACSRWAGGRLPRQQEWEAAARGPAGYRYPWGNDWQDGICNTAEAGLGVTSPVGLFPRSRQAALGIEDLAGNVMEWCVNETPGLDDGPPYARRGGSFAGGMMVARSSYREWDDMNNWAYLNYEKYKWAFGSDFDPTSGFRVVYFSSATAP